MKNVFLSLLLFLLVACDDGTSDSTIQEENVHNLVEAGFAEKEGYDHMKLDLYLPSTGQNFETELVRKASKVQKIEETIHFPGDNHSFTRTRYLGIHINQNENIACDINLDANNQVTSNQCSIISFAIEIPDKAYKNIGSRHLVEAQIRVKSNVSGTTTIANHSVYSYIIIEKYQNNMIEGKFEKEHFTNFSGKFKLNVYQPVVF